MNYACFLSGNRACYWIVWVLIIYLLQVFNVPVPVALRLRLGSAAARFLGLRVGIPPGAGMSVFREVRCVVR